MTAVDVKTNRLPECEPMSAENVETVRWIYECMARGDFWSTGAVFDPEIVWRWNPSMSGMTGVEEYRGLEGVESATRDFFEAWELFTQEAVELIDAGDSVVAVTRTHARPRGSDRALEGGAAEVWTFRGGKVIGFQQFDSREEALAAAGAGG